MSARKPGTVLVDLDGTLCDTSGRAHLLDVKPRDWAAYSAACLGDQPYQDVIDVVVGLHDCGWRIHLVTGRGDGAKEQTVDWLDIHHVPYWELHMRPAGDNRRNPDLKRAAAVELLQAGEDVRLAIDDHPGVAAVYAELGIPTLVVAQPEADKGILVEVAEGLAGQADNLPPAIAEVLSLIRDTFARKNADYAKDSAWRSNFDAIAEQMGFDAVTAADTLIAVKQARLQALTANGRSPVNEGIEDTRLDRAVYAVIALALYLEDKAKQ